MVERCPDKTEVDGPIPSTLTMPEKEIQKNPWWHEALEIFVRASAWIGTPIIVSLFLGRYLDERFNSEPWAFLSLTAFAFLVSCFGLVKETSGYMSRLSKEAEAEKQKQKND